MTFPGSTIGYTYDEATGSVAAISGPDAVTLSYSYDGAILTGTTWSGAVSGYVDRDHDDNLRVTARSVNGQAVAFQYDDDRIAHAGDLAISHDPDSGPILGTSLGKVTETWGRNGFGEIASYSAYDGTVLQTIT